MVQAIPLEADEAISAINAANRANGIKVALLRQGDALYVRAQWQRPEDAKPKQRKLALGLKASNPRDRSEASRQVKGVWAAIKQGEDPSKAVTSKKPTQTSTQRPRLIRDAIAAFEKAYFEERKRTTSTERSFKRLLTELNRLPPMAELSTQLLVETARHHTEPDSRSRLECVMTFKRLAKQCGLDAAELDALRGNYRSRGPQGRKIPSDRDLLKFLKLVRPTRYGWCICAMATYGVRPGEIPSLVLLDDGFATCLTTKTKRSLPSMRDVMALPKGWVNELNLQEIEIPGDRRWINPEDYESDAARAFVDNWIQWWNRKPAQLEKARKLMPNYQNYDLRHAWALRAINKGIPTSLAAKAMGHSEAVHFKHYERWLDKDALKQAMQAINRD